MLRSEGISDFTSSEWNLGLFTRICKLVSDKKAVGAETIISLVRENTHLTNRAVIARHIRIMSKIGLLAPPEEGYVSTGEGKAVLALIRDKTTRGYLTDYERLFYYLRLFKSAYVQLAFLLGTLSEQEHDEDKTSLSAKYFRRIYDSPYQIWPKATIREALNSYDRGRGVPKGLQTKFDCMLKWLQQLDLLKGTALTTKGSDLASYLTLHEAVPQLVYRAGVIYINGKPDFVRNYPSLGDGEKDKVRELFIEAYRLFETTELRMSDARAIWHYLWVKLLWDCHLALDENGFRILLDDLIEKKVVRSVSSGRDGKLSYVSVV